MRMIADAKEKKIDLILTKSLSRFARNTIDCLTVVRELRAINVDVFFEKENIYSSDPKVDFMLTIFSSIAQEESRNISENIKWGYRKRFKDGKVTINTSRFLGYDKDSDGKIIINQEEAKIVRTIFNMYISGTPTSTIAKLLVKNEMKNGRGVIAWSAPTIDSILTNEKYCGDAILQKRVVVDYLTHKSVENNGIVPKYYITNNHEGIIPKDVFESVQQLRKERRGASANSKYANQYPLSGIVRCGACGRAMNRHYFNYKNPNQRIVLSCKNNPKVKIDCSGKPIDYETLMEATTDIIKTLQTEMPTIVEELMQSLESSIEGSEIYESIRNKRDDIRSVETDIRKLIDLRIEQIEPERKQYYDLAINEKYGLVKSLNDEVDELQKHLLTNTKKQQRLNDVRSYLENSLPISRQIIESYFQDIIAISQNQIEFVLNDMNFTEGVVMTKTFTSTTTQRTLFCKVITQEGNHANI